jgi:hypothetical protein
VGSKSEIFLSFNISLEVILSTLIFTSFASPKLSGANLESFEIATIVFSINSKAELSFISFIFPALHLTSHFK